MANCFMLSRVSDLAGNTAICDDVKLTYVADGRMCSQSGRCRFAALNENLENRRREVQNSPRTVLVRPSTIADYAALLRGCEKTNIFSPRLSRKSIDASRAIGLPWPNPAASLERPSSKLSKPTGSPSPMRLMHTSPATSFRPGRHSSATCSAQCPGA
jgi:hypothetical protein